ncbi:hypothetical protein PX52LOC_05782 [Limnoglobus roseus]|uniref:Uncharacterized protein n=1 Tax=Limnoglobus roseus TaxID=2598579 RepID=A0A5C1AJ96_9BACT|nr:hypothetical protein PX52LOC_05782 [Limnoglobus roseus]
MTGVAYESGRRRAEVDGHVVCFQRITGTVRRSVVPIWRTEAKDSIHARRLAKRWVEKGKLGKPAVH